ncbi:Stomatin-like protein 2, mitochondrial [Aphelenchoides besseyi]|nr:Stomatin-like protein 2, mitochondrial [Aphelenchoides besseyi]
MTIGVEEKVDTRNSRSAMNSSTLLRTLRSTQRLALAANQNATRFIHRNTFVNFVPQQEAWVVERMGRFHKILDPGFNLLIPLVDRIKYVQSLKEIAIEIPQQGAITIDNVQLSLDGVLYLRVVDPYKVIMLFVAFVYSRDLGFLRSGWFVFLRPFPKDLCFSNPEYAVTQLAQTTMRSEVGKISLDTVFKEREQLNVSIVEALNKAAEPWGLTCMRYEIRTMTMPQRIQEAMQMQVEAERKKRAAILESEGKRDAAINVAEGEKQARILASEAYLREQINQAEGKAQAIVLEAEARRKGLTRVAESLNAKGGSGAASLAVAEQYVNWPRNTNTLIVPANAADANTMIAQAMTVYKKLSDRSTNSAVIESATPTDLPNLSDELALKFEYGKHVESQCFSKSHAQIPIKPIDSRMSMKKF